MRAALEHRQKVGEVYATFTSAETTGDPRNEQVAEKISGKRLGEPPSQCNMLPKQG